MFDAYNVVEPKPLECMQALVQLWQTEPCYAYIDVNHMYYQIKNGKRAIYLRKAEKVLDANNGTLRWMLYATDCVGLYADGVYPLHELSAMNKLKVEVGEVFQTDIRGVALDGEPYWTDDVDMLNQLNETSDALNKAVSMRTAIEQLLTETK